MRHLPSLILTLGLAALGQPAARSGDGPSAALNDGSPAVYYAIDSTLGVYVQEVSSGFADDLGWDGVYLALVVESVWDDQDIVHVIDDVGPLDALAILAWASGDWNGDFDLSASVFDHTIFGQVVAAFLVESYAGSGDDDLYVLLRRKPETLFGALIELALEDGDLRGEEILAIIGILIGM